MIFFVITDFYYKQAYSYSDEGITLRWSKEGLRVEQADPDSYLGEQQCVSGETIPWEALLIKKSVLLRYKGKEVRCTFSSPQNETSWIQFTECFPFEERLDAINSYFGCSYIEKKLSKGLYPSFFTSVIGLLKGLNLGSNNSLILNSIKQWEERFMSFLVDEASVIEDEKLVETINAIKNNI